MTEAVLMRSNISTISPLIVDNDNSAFLPVPPHATSDWLRDMYPLGTINGNQTYNTTLAWEFNKQAAGLFKLTLRCRRPPFAIPAGATFLRPMDWIGFADIKEVRFQYYSNIIYRFTREYLYSRMRNTLDLYKYISMAEMVCGAKTDAQRSQLAQAGHVTYTPLMMDFSFDTTKVCPIITLAQKPRLEIDTDLLQNVYQTDLAVGTALVDPGIVFDLMTDWINLNADEAAFLVARAAEDEGIAYINSNKMWVDTYNVQIASTINTATSQDFNLMNRGTVKEIEFQLQPQRLRTTVYGNDYFVYSNNPIPLPAPNGTITFGPYAPITDYFATANGNELFRRRATSFNIPWILNTYFKEYHTGAPGESRFRMVWSLSPEQENAAFGNMTLANLGNPKLTITFSPNGTAGLPGGTGIDPITAAVQTLVLYIVYYMYTYVQYQGGDVFEVFI
jgi:hypothetical protein